MSKDRLFLFGGSVRHDRFTTVVQIERIGTTVSTLGECPVWSVDESALYWEDIEGRRMHRFDPSTGAVDRRDLPGRPGSFAPSQIAGVLTVAMDTSLVHLDWASGSVETLLEIEDPSRGNRANDGRCDPQGRFVVGTMWPEPDDHEYTGSLYRIDRDGSVETLESNVGIPNGLVFDPERERMYWADTFRATIWAWDYDASTGQRSNKRVFFDYRASGARGLPDGACLDTEGCYWSASVNGWALTRITPDGDIDTVIDLPVAMPTMPAFGGNDLSTIFVTSIDGGEVDSTRSQGVPAGAVLAVDAGFQGVPETRSAL